MRVPLKELDGVAERVGEEVCVKDDEGVSVPERVLDREPLPVADDEAVLVCVRLLVGEMERERE